MLAIYPAVRGYYQLLKSGLLVILLTACLFAPTHGQAEEPVPNLLGPSLALTIRPESDKVHLGDALAVQFSIKNVGTKDYYYLQRPSYNRWIYPGNGEFTPEPDCLERTDDYELSCISESGQKVDVPPCTSQSDQTTDTLLYLWMNPSPRYSYFSTLKPGQEFHEMVLLDDWAKIVNPGKYIMTGTYRGHAFPAINPSGSVQPPTAVASSATIIEVLPEAPAWGSPDCLN